MITSTVERDAPPRPVDRLATFFVFAIAALVASIAVPVIIMAWRLVLR